MRSRHWAHGRLRCCGTEGNARVTQAAKAGRRRQRRMLFGDGFTFDRDLDRAGKMHTAAAVAKVKKKSGDNSEAERRLQADYKEKFGGAVVGEASEITCACVAQLPNSTTLSSLNDFYLYSLSLKLKNYNFCFYLHDAFAVFVFCVCVCVCVYVHTHVCVIFGALFVSSLIVCWDKIPTIAYFLMASYSQYSK